MEKSCRRLLTLRIRWPTVISWFPSRSGWAALRGPPSTRSHPGTVRGTPASYKGISAASPSRGSLLLLPSRPRSLFRPWTRPRPTWPGWACCCCWLAAAGCPSAGALRRGCLSPDSPPARLGRGRSTEGSTRRRWREAAEDRASTSVG